MDDIINVTIDTGSSLFPDVVTFVQNKYQNKLKAFPPPSNIYAVVINIQEYKILAAVAIDFGWNEKEFFYERMYILPNNFLHNQTRDRIVYFSKLASVHPGAGKRVLLYAFKYSLTIGAKFGTCIASKKMLEHLHSLGIHWQPIDGAILKKSEVDESTSCYFNNEITSPCINLLSDLLNT